MQCDVLYELSLSVSLHILRFADCYLQQATREAFAVALADLAAAAKPSNPALAAAVDAEKKPAKRQQLEKLAGGMLKAALVQPFVDAAVAGNKVSRGQLLIGKLTPPTVSSEFWRVLTALQALTHYLLIEGRMHKHSVISLLQAVPTALQWAATAAKLDPAGPSEPDTVVELPRLWLQRSAIHTVQTHKHLANSRSFASAWCACLRLLLQDVLTALGLGWSSFASSLDPSSPDSLVDLAVKAVETLELAHKAAAEAAVKGQLAHDANNIGACLAGRHAVCEQVRAF